MSEQTGISWADHTFNPWWGCQRVSPACEHCYAETFSKRVGFQVWGPQSERRFFDDDHWREPLRWNEKAKQAGIRRRVFCASMADVFEDRPDLVDERARLFVLIDETPDLDWLLLTKRPQNIAAMMPKYWGGAVWPNVWLGTTAENQRYAEERLPHLVAVDAVRRFISYEPALGPLDLRQYLLLIDWLIAGGESGHHARPSHPNWYRSVRDQCIAAGTWFHFKQWGTWKPIDEADWMDDEPRCGVVWPDGLSGSGILGDLESARQRGVQCVLKAPRGGKWKSENGGSLLDGREWNEFPTAEVFRKVPA